MKYVTKNKLKIIEILKANEDRHLTIEEIFELSNKEVPIASIYRIIDQLLLEGVVRKYVVDKNLSACFQYVGDGSIHSHFHLICTKCRKLFHLECSNVNNLISHIEEHHGFKVDISRVNLYGICEECQKRL